MVNTYDKSNPRDGKFKRRYYFIKWNNFYCNSPILGMRSVERKEEVNPAVLVIELRIRLYDKLIY